MGLGGTAARGLIVAAYGLAFGVALPLALLACARALDAAAGWRAAPSPWGFVLAVPALALVAAAVVQLAVEGHGPPVSAVPPSRLARRGPYRFARHPIYLGFNVAAVGAGLAIGSPALSLIVAPALLPLWLAYAWIEDRALARRFGRSYRTYRRRVGLVPPLPLVTSSRLAARAWPTEFSGCENVPRRGPAILVANHCCYLDPAFVGRTTLRRVHFLATAEAYRRPALAAYLRGVGAVPVRRYVADPRAAREVVRLLEAGELVGVFPEGERSPLGEYGGALDAVARAVCRLGAPVIPVGISGSYDCGPRWADVLRRGRVQVAVGGSVSFGGGDPARAVDRALVRLLRQDPQPVRLDGRLRRRLGRVLWRCPDCLREAGWRAAELRCTDCGARWTPEPTGGLRTLDGSLRSLAALGARVWAVPETGALHANAAAARERATTGPIRPLLALGEGRLEASPDGLAFREVRIALGELASITIEGADVLQVAARGEMWQFRLEAAFRMRNALEAWRRSWARAA
ncbi:MAG TPA: 1-acyl-sn-glycerol-3-phosphate acyltransferase [Vicinamibacteria bacterium]|nr:1-acyl-sn-glycerol-3-phosphate acyltransferase [Vicinamibacteria bacterium]